MSPLHISAEDATKKFSIFCPALIVTTLEGDEGGGGGVQKGGGPGEGGGLPLWLSAF